MRARVISGFFLLIALASPAFAADWQGAGRPSLDRVLPEIRRHTPGAFYDAEGPFIGADGLARYRIKWMMPDGRIVWFDADARTGRVLGPVPSGSRFGNYDDDRYYGGGNPGHFGNWPDYDRGPYGGGGRGRYGSGGRDGGNWGRGGSGHGNFGRGDYRRGHDDRH
jgi:hypothetical protein